MHLTSAASVSAISFPPVLCPKKHIEMICPRGSLSGFEYTPTIPFNSISRPVSSLVSLKAADSTVSPYSTKPPGKAHEPAYGEFLRFISTKESLSVITVSTVKRGFLMGTLPLHVAIQNNGSKFYGF